MADSLPSLKRIETPGRFVRQGELEGSLVQGGASIRWSQVYDQFEDDANDSTFFIVGGHLRFVFRLGDGSEVFEGNRAYVLARLREREPAILAAFGDEGRQFLDYMYALTPMPTATPLTAEAAAAKLNEIHARAPRLVDSLLSIEVRVAAAEDARLGDSVLGNEAGRVTMLSLLNTLFRPTGMLVAAVWDEDAGTFLEFAPIPAAMPKSEPAVGKHTL